MSRNDGKRLGMSAEYLSGKKFLSVVFLLIFLIISLLYISPKKNRTGSNHLSSQLRQVITEDETSERIDFVDQNGIITIAADRGFATIITTKTENSRLERYYDEKGQPASRFNGYYAAFYEYDDKGNNIRISYLGIDDKPMIMANGYAIEEREYNENGQNKSVRYYDTEGNPILTKLNGYGKTIEYAENGKTSRTIFVDASGAPMMTGQGLAIIERNYYISDGPENGKVESEFYFNEKGVPVSLSLGQYGIHKEYDENGRDSVLTYLDDTGQPVSTNKGYSTILRTYQADANIATEQYFDLNGNPFALSEGQYGIKVNEDQTVYLNQNGEESFNLKNFLYNHTRLIIPLALTFVIFSSLAGRKQNAVFLIICITVIIYMTLLFRDSESAGHSGLLRYYRRILFDSGARADIIKNVWLFIPLGTVLYRLYPKAAILLVPIALSALIEGIQWLAGIGTCELDDVISNESGGWIGFCMGRLAADIKLGINHRRQRYSA